LTIGRYALKGKFQGRSALRFIGSLKEASPGGLGVVHTGQHRSVAATP